MLSSICFVACPTFVALQYLPTLRAHSLTLFIWILFCAWIFSYYVPTLWPCAVTLLLCVIKPCDGRALCADSMCRPVRPYMIILCDALFLAWIMALNRASLPVCVVCVTLLSLFLLLIFPLPTPWLVIHFIFVNSNLFPLCLLVLFVPTLCLSSVFLLTLPVPTFWLCALTVFVHSILHQNSWSLCSYCNSRILPNIQLDHISAMQVHIAIHASSSTFNLNPLIFIF